MTRRWGKLDTKLYQNDKFRGLSAATIGIWLICLSWAADNETDGFLPDDIIAGFMGKHLPRQHRDKYIRYLVEVGLWETGVGGYMIHDFGDYQLTKESKTEIRAADVERQQRSRARRAPVTRSSRARHAPVARPSGDVLPLGEVVSRRDTAPKTKRKRESGVTTSLQRADPAQPIIDRWVVACGALVPPDGQRKRLAEEINKLLDQGYPFDMVERAVAEWHKRNWHPSTLPSIYDQLQRGIVPRFATATADARAQNTLELGASLIARGIE